VNTQRFAVSDKLELRQADHDVAIRGWDEDAIELTLDGDADECAVEQQESTLIVTAHIPLAIHVPRRTAVSVGQTAGDLLLRDLDGPVHVGTANGDLSIRSGQASVSLDEVYGDLAVEHLNGPLSVRQAHGSAHLGRMGAVSLGRVHGDVNARAISGDLRMSAVRGAVQARDVAGLLMLEDGQDDFQGQDLAGGMDVHSVKGNLSLKTALTPGLTYTGRANGDIVARFPEGTSARLTLEAGGQISAKGLQVEEEESGRMVAQAGDGEAQVALYAGGDLSVRVWGEDQDQPWGFSMDELGEQISAEIARHVEKIGEGFPDFGALVSREVENAMRHVEREIEKAQRQAERAARQAQKHARAAEERTRQAQEKAQQKARQFHAKFEHRWGPPPGAVPGSGRSGPGPRSRGLSREEQLAVLKMLQEGRISAEEAETLLKALGI
jgi:hypothetical protein